MEGRKEGDSSFLHTNNVEMYVSLGNAYHYRGKLPNNQIFVAPSKFKLK